MDTGHVDVAYKQLSPYTKVRLVDPAATPVAEALPAPLASCLGNFFGGMRMEDDNKVRDAVHVWHLYHDLTHKYQDTCPASAVSVMMASLKVFFETKEKHDLRPTIQRLRHVVDQLFAHGHWSPERQKKYLLAAICYSVQVDKLGLDQHEQFQLFGQDVCSKLSPRYERAKWKILHKASESKLLRTMQQMDNLPALTEVRMIKPDSQFTVDHKQEEQPKNKFQIRLFQLSSAPHFRVLRVQEKIVTDRTWMDGRLVGSSTRTSFQALLMDERSTGALEVRSQAGNNSVLAEYR